MKKTSNKSNRNILKFFDYILMDSESNDLSYSLRNKFWVSSETEDN